MSDYDFSKLNLSELVELCWLNGFVGAHRGQGRELLVGQLRGKHAPGEFPADPVDDERESMMEMKAEWPIIFDQLGCASEFYACWHCPAARAYICAVEECDPDIRKRIKEGAR